MKPLIIIHPKDESTLFLNPIWSGETLKYMEKVEVINVDHSDEAHAEALGILSKAPRGSNLLFLGHGTSFSLEGASNADYNHKSFVSKNNINILDNLNLLCLSCKSADFLRHFKQLKYVGFGDLPTHMAEIVGIREHEYNAYPKVDEAAIENFKVIIVDVISVSIFEWMTLGLDTRALYHRIRIRLMNEINVLLQLNSVELQLKRGVLDLLVDMRGEMSFR